MRQWWHAETATADADVQALRRGPRTRAKSSNRLWLLRVLARSEPQSLEPQSDSDQPQGHDAHLAAGRGLRTTLTNGSPNTERNGCCGRLTTVRGFLSSNGSIWRFRSPLSMTRILLWLIVAAVLVIGFLFYRSQPRDRLNVTSYAEQEIERAKRDKWNGLFPYHARIVSGLATEATSRIALRLSRFPISASVVRAQLDNYSREGSLALKIRFSAARYSFRAKSSWFTEPSRRPEVSTI
jgi:hypothetical protein